MLNGCVATLIAILTTLIIGFSSYFSTSMSPMQAMPDEIEYPFVLADGVVSYSFKETFNCQYGIVGKVEFLPEYAENHDNIIVMIQPLTYDDRPAGRAYIGSDNSYGLIAVGKYWYYVWVHDLTLGMPLSEEILVDKLDCASERILAQLNFRQVQALG